MFRPEAIEKRNIKWRGSAILLRGVVPPWLIALACIAFLLAFLIFVTAGTYTRRVNVSGEITTWPRAINIYSSAQGFIVEQFVTEGQRIKKGAPIYQIDVSKSTHSGVVDDNQRKEINNQLIRLNHIIANLEENKKTTLQTLKKQQEQYRYALNRSTEILQRAEEGLHIIKKNMDSYRDYQSKGLINKDQLISQVALYYQHQNSFLGLSAQHEQNGLQIISLESQIQTQAAEFDNRIHEMALKRHELQKELTNTDAGHEIIVRTLSDGKIDSLNMTVGQMVNPGDSLLQIMPEKVNHYYLVIWVPNDAMPYIAVGDKVNIRYEAFSAEKFGQFRAKVSLISKTPASSQEMLTYPGAPKSNPGLSVPYYKVVVKPEKPTITYDGKKIQLENGMKAQVTLFLEKRKIYQWMFSPFYDMKYSATGAVDAG